jgi:hypothetical protein
MKLTIKTKEVAGTERGGADLFVVVKASCKDEPTPNTLGPDFHEAWNAWVATLPLTQEAAEATDSDFYVEMALTKTARLKSTYGAYEDSFFVDWDLLEAKDRVSKVVFEGGWVMDLKSSKYKVKGKVFVDGNAE